MILASISLSCVSAADHSVMSVMQRSQISKSQYKSLVVWKLTGYQTIPVSSDSWKKRAKPDFSKRFPGGSGAKVQQHSLKHAAKSVTSAAVTSVSCSSYFSSTYFESLRVSVWADCLRCQRKAGVFWRRTTPTGAWRTASEKTPDDIALERVLRWCEQRCRGAKHKRICFYCGFHLFFALFIHEKWETIQHKP